MRIADNIQETSDPYQQLLLTRKNYLMEKVSFVYQLCHPEEDKEPI